MMRYVESITLIVKLNLKTQCYWHVYVIIMMGIYCLRNYISHKLTNNDKKDVIFKNCAPFTDFMSEMNYMQVDNVEEIDVVISMYNSIKYSNNYQKNQENYGNFIEMIQLQMMLVLLLI